MSIRFRALALAVAVTCLAAISCEVDNDNDATCYTPDCEYTCEAYGYAGGACDLNGVCACLLADGGAYAFDGGTAADASTSASSVGEGGSLR
jgi:hypothetical protein